MSQGLDHQSLENFKKNFAIQEEKETSLSDQVFASPTEFLTTLKQALPKIAPAHGGFVTEKDLFDYAHHGADEKLRGVATVAYNHFQDIDNFGLVEARDAKTCTDQILSAAEISLDLTMVSENYARAGKGYLSLHSSEDFGLRGLLHMSDTPDDKDIREIVNRAYLNNKTMAGWPELNGGTK